MKVVYFSRFLPKQDGDGGSRRMVQVYELFKNHQCRIISAAENNEFSNLPVNLPEIKNARIRWDDVEFKIKVTNNDYFKWAEHFRDWLFYMRFSAYSWAGLIAEGILPLDVAVIDDPMYFAPLVDKLNDLKIPVIGNAHNIETHVLGQIVPAYQYELFKSEIDYLKKCDLVITISHEDTVVLNNFGVNTVLLEYHPVKEQEEIFLQIRDKRKKSTKSGWLLMGTAHNIPTRDGMVEIINYWLSNEKIQDEKLYLVGFGTENLVEIVGFSNKANIQILGGVDAEKLKELLISAKGVIIFQRYGTGALTKIQELLIAGVPVIANHHAARSYHNRKGLIEYNNVNDLHEKLSGVKEQETMIFPLPDKPGEKLVLESIRCIVALSTTTPDPVGLAETQF